MSKKEKDLLEFELESRLGRKEALELLKSESRKVYTPEEDEILEIKELEGEI